MLFLLTGDIQTGKTRWLEALLKIFDEHHTHYAGVIAPGVWKKHDTGELEKLGIDNVLLPQKERISFARRRDLAQIEGSFDSKSQSAQEKLGWEISEDALAKVNDYFETLLQEHRKAIKESTEDPSATNAVSKNIMSSSFLIVDELGRLELLRGGGLTNATSLIASGPSVVFPHALVIVRETLLPHAHEHFDAAWNNKVEEILPNDEAKEKILQTLCKYFTNAS